MTDVREDETIDEEPIEGAEDLPDDTKDGDVSEGDDEPDE